MPMDTSASLSLQVTPAAVLRDVDVRYGPLRALDRASLRVPLGGLCGLIGPNGAGKTTAMRLIATDLVADGGEVEVFGHALPREGDAVRRRLGFMPDAVGLYEELTLVEYLDFFAAFYGLSPARRASAVEATLDLTGLRRLAVRRLTGLSKGERQRVSLARTLIHDPELLLLDEPAEGLDPRARVELRELLLLLHERGKTILISSHILAELEEICTHVILIDRGQVLFQGSRRKLLADRLQRCVVRIESLDPIGPLVERLSREPGVALVDESGAAVAAEVPGDPRFSSELLARLVAAGFRISSFARRTDSLETVYLRLTQARESPPDGEAMS
jgi:ABC-2 type transport system ATP-binding protein